MTARFLMLALLFNIFNFNVANAEQAAAAEYRKIFRTGNFYIEFRDKWGTRILAGKNGMRMERMRYDFESGDMAWLNPLGAIFNKEDKNPEVLYRDGKFYQFIEKKRANVCDANKLHDEKLNPRSGWNKIAQKLALPDELAVFYWEDSFRLKSPAIPAPTFKKSFKKSIEGKDYDCDRYSCDIKNLAGGGSASLVYEMSYKDGHLFRAESYLVRSGNIYPLNTLKIQKIQSEIPKDTFKIEKNTELYAAGMGGFDDLLEQPKKIGTLEAETLSTTHD